jgi:hypothetical protein
MPDSVPIHFHDELQERPLSEIFELLDLTAKNLRRIQRLTVHEVGLTPPQYHLLHLLWEQDERPFKDLAEASACTRATITGIVDTLERKGLVVRKPNPVDRRRHSFLAQALGTPPLRLAQGRLFGRNNIYKNKLNPIIGDKQLPQSIQPGRIQISSTDLQIHRRFEQRPFDQARVRLPSEHSVSLGQV